VIKSIVEQSASMWQSCNPVEQYPPRKYVIINGSNIFIYHWIQKCMSLHELPECLLIIHNLEQKLSICFQNRSFNLTHWFTIEIFYTWPWILAALENPFFLNIVVRKVPSITIWTKIIVFVKNSSIFTSYRRINATDIFGCWTCITWCSNIFRRSLKVILNYTDTFNWALWVKT